MIRNGLINYRPDIGEFILSDIYQSEIQAKEIRSETAFNY